VDILPLSDPFSCPQLDGSRGPRHISDTPRGSPVVALVPGGQHARDERIPGTGSVHRRRFLPHDVLARAAGRFYIAPFLPERDRDHLRKYIESLQESFLNEGANYLSSRPTYASS
jgi:hypothetical protein